MVFPFCHVVGATAISRRTDPQAKQPEKGRGSRFQFGFDLLFNQRAVQRDGHGLNDIVQWAVDKIATDEIEIAAESSGENIDIDPNVAIGPLQPLLVNPSARHLDGARLCRHLHILAAKVDATERRPASRNAIQMRSDPCGSPCCNACVSASLQHQRSYPSSSHGQGRQAPATPQTGRKSPA
ncbi:hypothetical protein [Paracoccus alcaliphilus]|uniref:hypothetical protein n=1 Tax=Paracoccus alcaliphilus TaxID=34002 RepID=UPI00111368B1|nr:hypothetical protein [Paracoccus alcaliphilus]WCR21017.1 hypothetical protein JHW40_22655 [Paracoccus alcaliphilus]